MKRTNIQGHTLVADPEQVRAIRRLSTMTISQLFLHAKEYGQAKVQLDDVAYVIIRHPDHTFTLRLFEQHHSAPL